MSEPFYITTAIDYVNSDPHLGTAYEKVGADVTARYMRLAGRDVRFLMGNDENSLNVARKAEEAGLDPLEYCDRMEERFRGTWEALLVSYDDFIRTTQPRHRLAVEEMIRRIDAKGDIYKGRYEGWYCVGCEAFKREDDLVNGECPDHRQRPEWVVEENYFFALSRYQDFLLQYYQEHPEFVQPEIRRNECLAWLKAGLEDISVSRARGGWGIPFPSDAQAVIYVWFDALTNYLAGAGFPEDQQTFERYWPADLHVVGKNITRFHCLIWPAMLHSAGLPLPRVVFGHGFLHLGGERMSKTLGTVVDPRELATQYGPDAIRYFLIREVPWGGELDFTPERLEERINRDLGNDLGNLLHRTLSMLDRYQDGRVEIPSAREGRDLVETANRVREAYHRAMIAYDPQGAVKAVWELITRANAYVEESQPWRLAKEGQEERLREVLYTLAETLRHIVLYLAPVMPGKMAEAWSQLGLDEFDRTQFSDLERFGTFPEGVTVCREEPLFPRIE